MRGHRRAGATQGGYRSAVIADDLRDRMVAHGRRQRRGPAQQPGRRPGLAGGVGELLPKRDQLGVVLFQVVHRGEGNRWPQRETRRAAMVAQPGTQFLGCVVEADDAAPQRLKFHVSAGQAHLHVEARALHRIDAGDLGQQDLARPFDLCPFQVAVGLAGERVMRAYQARLAPADAHEPLVR